MLTIFSVPADSPEKQPAKPAKKVELDLDDAPFLKDEPEKKPEPAQKSATVTLPPPAPDQDQAAAKTTILDKLKAQKKKLILAGGAAVILIVAAVAVNIFLSGGAPAEKPKAEEQAVEKIVVTNAPPVEPEAAGPAHTISWDPFWVEVRDPEGEVHFFVCKLSFPTDDQPVAIEMENKKTVMRDSVFYYLRNRPYEFLSDTSNIPALKHNIIKVINDNIRNGELKDLLLEEYRII